MANFASHMGMSCVFVTYFGAGRLVRRETREDVHPYLHTFPQQATGSLKIDISKVCQITFARASSCIARLSQVWPAGWGKRVFEPRVNAGGGRTQGKIVLGKLAQHFRGSQAELAACAAKQRIDSRIESLGRVRHDGSPSGAQT